MRPMLSATVLENDDTFNESAGTSCDSFLRNLAGLGQLAPARHYPKGSVLFVEGQTARGIYILCEGRVKISIASPEGRTLVLRIAHPGDLLGVNAAVTGEPYGATAEAIDPCRIQLISREALSQLVDRDKNVYLGVAQALSRTLSHVVEHTRLLFLSQTSAEKLARLLVKWCNEHGKTTPRGIRIDSGLTHEEIAQMICASRETVTRLLGEFKRKRILSFVDGVIIVRNRKALESVARC